MLTRLSKYVFFPLWEIKDRSHRRQYLRELSASQWRDPEQIRTHQWNRLQQMVGYAFNRVEYYSARYGSLGFNGALENWAQFEQLPILEKDDIRKYERALLAAPFGPGDLVQAKTGGSTGKSLTVYFDHRCQEQRNAAAMRSDRWAGWDIGMKVAAIWGNPPIADTVKKKLRNLLLDRTMYLDTMDINEGTVRQFAAAWVRERARIIFGHSHSIYMLAMYLEKLGIAVVFPEGIVSTSMMLLEPERRLIERVFRCQVTNRYGCEEVGLIACECEEHDGLHLNADHLIVEFLRDDGLVANPGEEANIVVTDLINYGMPLIRYRVGDMGKMSARICRCGRGLPLMECIIGRQADFLRKPDGSLVAGVSLVERTLTAIPGLEQMQLIQNELHKLSIKVVKGRGFNEESESALRKELLSVFGGSITMHIDYVTRLDQSRAGKYRFSICNL